MPPAAHGAGPGPRLSPPPARWARRRGPGGRGGAPGKHAVWPSGCSAVRWCIWWTKIPQCWPRRLGSWRGAQAAWRCGPSGRDAGMRALTRAPAGLRHDERHSAPQATPRCKCHSAQWQSACGAEGRHGRNGALPRGFMALSGPEARPTASQAQSPFLSSCPSPSNEIKLACTQQTEQRVECSNAEPTNGGEGDVQGHKGGHRPTDVGQCGGGPAELWERYLERPAERQHSTLHRAPMFSVAFRQCE